MSSFDIFYTFRVVETAEYKYEEEEEEIVNQLNKHSNA